TTPSGGLHLYYRAPDGVALRNTAGTSLGWKIDTRAHGGYVRAPGALVHGHPYTVVHDTDPVPLPAWLLTRLRPTPLPPHPTDRHSGTSVTELVYRKQIRPVVEDGAVTMDRLFPTRGEVRANHDGRTDGDPRKLGEHDSRDVDPT
ncbi:MAG: bifunctional DNA primase/polymerase, partial [Actinobacteria bacterium]|nr:bifunctional DNA primase/polymerase [Actinomycetota bacterium]